MRVSDDALRRLQAVVDYVTERFRANQLVLYCETLIDFNKLLTSVERLPHAMALTSWHMFTTFLLCNMFCWLRPDLFPTMRATEDRRLAFFH